MEVTLEKVAQRLAKAASSATETASNEQSLRHELENALKDACSALGIPWTPYQLDRTLLRESDGAVRFADVIHGAVIIEYEPPKSFRAKEASAQLDHARRQAEEYAELTALEEDGHLRTTTSSFGTELPFPSVGRGTPFSGIA